MNAKPTPGPWVVNSSRPVAGCNGDIAITTKHDSIVAVAFLQPGVETNAALIVAAVNACLAANPDNPLAVAEGVAEVVEALREIQKGEGVYNSDPLTHAGNCIEEMKELARAALAKIEAKP